MRRREFITALGGASIVWPASVRAQQPARTPFVGVLSPITPEAAAANIRTFRQSLQSLGYVEGENISVEYRFAGGRHKAYATLAAELVGLRPDVIVVGSVDAVIALHKSTATIPLVGIGMTGDLVGLGLVASYKRPGGNVTGLHYPLLDEMTGKRASLLKEFAPGILRIGVVYNPDDIGTDELFKRSASEIGRTLNLDVRLYPVREVGQFDAVFTGAERERVDGFCVIETTLAMANRERIVTLVNRLGRPAIYGLREFVAAGGLLSYSASLPDEYRRAAIYVDRIVKGTKPGDLPIDEAAAFDLAINLKTARALGLTAPPSLLAQATEVLE